MQINDFIEKVEKDKISIIRTWISSPAVIKIIDDYSINKDLFVKRYAFGVIEHYIQVVKKQEKIENCPVVIDFIKYLKKQNIKASELFLLCSAFKSALVDFVFKLNIQSIELIEKIVYFFENNFSGVLDIYSKSIAQIESALNKSIDIVDKYVIMSRTDINGIIMSVSSAFCKISGYEAFELIGKSHNVIKHPQMPQELFQNLWETIKSGNMWQGEIKNLKKNGDFYWVKTTIHPNFDNVGNIISYDAIREDITSQIELKTQQNLLVEQSKSAAMGEMISMIAHQWRQPLTAITATTNNLQIKALIDEKIDTQQLQEELELITNYSQHLSLTIDDFRNFFKPDKIKTESKLEDIIEKAINIIKTSFESKNINLITNYSFNDTLFTYASEIQQVILIILKNAEDILMEKNIENKLIKINTFKENNFAIIQIEDNGGGIAMKIINKIFDPYFSTKKSKEGTGIGLYMSKIIIDEHCLGNLSVKNSTKGATFEIKLPIKI